YLLTLLAWWRFLETRRWHLYGAAVVCFLGAMLSKTIVCTLPAALLLLTWWRESPTWRQAIALCAPFLIIRSGLALITIWREHVEPHPDVGLPSLDLLQHVLLAARVLWFYAAKLVWPVDLMTVYPQWVIDVHSPWQYVPLIGALAVPAVLWGY